MLDPALRTQIRDRLASFPVHRLAVGTQRHAAVAVAIAEEGTGAAMPASPHPTRGAMHRR